MPRPAKKGKIKGAKTPPAEQANGNGADSNLATATAIVEPPVEELQGQPAPEEPAEAEKPEKRPPAERVEKADKHRLADQPEQPPVGDKDRIATSLNIAKLQSMQMSELNQMARDLSVENFGTMRKHEVIFHILQKNAERAGVLFSEGVLEVLPEGFGFLRSQSFNYLPCPEDIYVSPSQIRRFDLQTGNLVAGQN